MYGLDNYVKTFLIKIFFQNDIGLTHKKPIIFGEIRAQSQKIAKKGRFLVTQNYKTRISWPFIDRNGITVMT